MEKLLGDIEILIRNYSAYRGAIKWRTYRESSSPPENPISYDGVYVKIFRNSYNVLDCYPISALMKRLEIKRNPSLFQTIFKLWQLINPSALRSISKEVYTVVVESLYKMNQQSLGNPSLTIVNLKNDMEVDFSNKLGLTFAEYYDVVFECIDVLAKSTLISEYCRIIERCTRVISESPIFSMTNLHSKLHLKEPQRVSYYSWMQNLMRNLTPTRNSEQQLPEIFKRVILPRDDRAVNRISQKIPRNESSKLSKGFSIKEAMRKSKSPIRSITPKLINARTNDNNLFSLNYR
ncbi:hypothetical protein SteCoe_22224 [Stentor coeruleus]|uniref:Uncharacterized protein n=1 Tax=Stentor coeruleus TaxID=5963 RepID=A0A1R2BMS7_9CILI|nr:hypothetical protein SteCoe_22224 [Stentor coeruleus]